MAVTTTKTNKPINPRGNDQSPKGYNRAALYSGKALDFDGTNDSISEQTISIDTTSFSVSVYAKADALASNSSVFSFGDGSTFDLILYPYDSAASGVRIYDKQIPGTLLDGVSAELGVYNMFTMQCDGEFLELYINGQFVKKSARTYSSTYTRIQFGKVVTIAQYFNGQIANARLFNTALTAAQVSDLYNNPEKIVPTGVSNDALKLWLPMMEGAGTTAYDGSGNGNHGTISGATYVNGVGAPVAQSAVIDWNKGSNLAYYSEELNNAYYNKSGVTITANDTTAPNGLDEAEKGLETTATAYRDVVARSFGVTASNSYTLSAFVKNGLGRDGVYLYTNDGSGNGRCAKFNLSTGAYIGNAGAGGWTAFDSYGIESAPNGWYRIHATLNSSSGGTKTFNVGLSDNTNDALGPYTGDVTKGLYIWGYQFQDNAVGPYVRTSGANQPSPVLLPQGLISGRDITGVNLFENVRKQGALNLDGNSWAEVHDNASLDVSALTCEGWMYAESITGINNRIVNKWNSNYPERSFQLYGQNATINWMLSDGSAAYSITGGTLTQGEWHHVVGTYDGSTQKIYLNGVQVQSTALSITLKQSSFKVMLGGYTTGLYSLNPIAQPRIYNRALTAEEVERNYNAGKNIYK